MFGLVLLDAIYALLDGDATITQLAPGGVWDDDVPTGSAFPYLVVRNPTEGPFDTLTSKGRDATVMIDVWSKAHGDTEALGVAARVNALLDDTDTLALAGWTLVRSHVEQVTTLRDPDGVHRRAMLTVRVVAQEA